MVNWILLRIGWEEVSTCNLKLLTTCLRLWFVHDEALYKCFLINWLITCTRRYCDLSCLFVGSFIHRSACVFYCSECSLVNRCRWRQRLGSNGPPIGNGIWRIKWWPIACLAEVVVSGCFFHFNFVLTGLDSLKVRPGYHSEFTAIRAPSSKKWNFRTKFLENFRTISGHFCRFHEAQDTENARFSVLINVNHWSRSVLPS